LLLYQLLLYVWMLKGFPEALAKLTLFKNSQAKRAFFVFGFANVVITLLYVGHSSLQVSRKTGAAGKAFVFAIIFLPAFVLNFLINRDTGRFFSITQVFNATILFALLNWLVVFFKEGKTFQYLFFAATVTFVSSNILINPLSKGLGPYLENKLYKKISQINEQDPNAGWLVFGHMTAPDFVKATGANCFNGVQYAPELDKLHVLDPTLKNEGIYNRYAHILFFPLIDGKDSVSFSLNSADLYTVKADPCSPRLKQIGIKYYIFAYKPTPIEVRCMVPVGDTVGFYIYKRID